MPSFQLFKCSRIRRRQQGLSMILLVFLIGLAATGFVVRSLSAGSFQIQRSVDSAQALAEAKAAVIGNVISGQSGTSAGQFPCTEDTSSIGTSNEGQALGNCSNTLTSIGRFAWRTLGTGDLRDGNNDKLWYALSPGFRAAPVNSDTVAGLSIDGVQNQAITILFSPGMALSGQSRPTPTASSGPIVTAYLETENSDGDKDFITGISSTTFNDKLVAIKPDDIFPLLEKRVLGEFKSYLKAYKAVWGAFPFPAIFGNPTTATYVGDTTAALSGGFIPISNANPTTTWNTTTPPVPAVVLPAGNVVSAPACTFRTSNTRIRCDITISTYNSANPPTVSISGIVNNIGLGFYNGLDVSKTSDIQITTRSGSATVTSASRAITHSLNAAGNGTVTFSGTLANTGVVRVEYRRTPPLSNWVLAATNHYLLSYNAITNIGNDWHHLVYYKVAQPFLPGGTSTCDVLCLTVNKINVTPNITQTGIHALLISSGRKLDATNARTAPTYSSSNPAQARPGATLDDYLDSANNTTANLIFDSTNLPLSTFNDQVGVVE